MNYRNDAVLVLEDGRTFPGRAIGAVQDVLGEVVFNTSMTGYQEICTDPSYRGQIVVFTAPQIGNYGVAEADSQSPRHDRARLAGVVVRELSGVTSNWRADNDLHRWLVSQGVGGITEVDTRALTRHLRDKGAMRGGIFRAESVSEQLKRRVMDLPPMEGQDLASQVTTAEPYEVPPTGGSTVSRRRRRFRRQAGHPARFITTRVCSRGRACRNLR
jgi:carbamoyl-phosphate synthase small subunit